MNGGLVKARAITVLFLSLATLASLSPPVTIVAASQDDDVLSVTGCLLMSRKEGVYSLHMEYNTIAVMGHVDLPNHLGHRVTLTGDFEERDGGLRFIVDEIVHIASSCEANA